MRSRRVAIGVGGGVVLLAALDAYVITTIFVSVVGDLGIPINHLERATPIMTGFLLGYVAAMPLLGQLSDRYGRRPLLQLCLAGFAIGSAVTAFAHDVPWLTTGRVIQGVAGGALLPVTMALAGDLWEDRQRPVVLGVVGAGQELGSVLGPLYGAGIAAWLDWRAIFWINIPVTILAMLAVQGAVPSARVQRTGWRLALVAAVPLAVVGLKDRDLPWSEQTSLAQVSLGLCLALMLAVALADLLIGAGRAQTSERSKVDVVGGFLLALGLGLLVGALYNPEPGKSPLPPWGLPVIIAGFVVLVAFVLWETRSKTRLLDLGGVPKGPLFATLGVSLLSGAALMVTLVDVQLVAQTLLGKDSLDGALILVRFLVALPIAAIAGGLLARRVGDRWPMVAGMAISAVGYLLIAGWPHDLAAAKYGPLPRMDVDLVLTGLGLGLVIAPVSSAVLRVMPSAQHGVASAAVVVARMMGMLLGISALSAWGFYRFQSLTRKLQMPLPFGLPKAEAQRQINTYKAAVQDALRTEYREIFLITAALCLLAAVIAVAVRDRTHEHPRQQREEIAARAD